MGEYDGAKVANLANLVAVAENFEAEMLEQYKQKCFKLQQDILDRKAKVSLKLVRDVCLTNAHFKDK